MQKSNKTRHFLFASIIVLLSVGLSIAAAEFVLRLIQPSNTSGGQLQAGLFTYHPQLGWTLTRDWRGSHVHHDYNVRYSVNGFGHRGTTIGAENTNQKRYAYLGDSFTFGMGVNDKDTFTELLNHRSQGQKLHLNFGHPGYSTDQELIYARERIFRFEPNVVVLMVYLGNDLIDNMAAIPLQVDLPKPYFELSETRLVLRNTPVPRQASSGALGRRSLARILLEGVPQKTDLLASSEILRRLGYKPRAQDLTAVMPERVDPSIELFLMLADELNELVQRSQGQLVVALLPGRSFVTDPKGYSAQYQDYIRRSTLEQLAGKNILTIDIGTELRLKHAEGKQPLYHPFDGHLTPSGHNVLADLLEKELP